MLANKFMFGFSVLIMFYQLVNLSLLYVFSLNKLLFVSAYVVASDFECQPFILTFCLCLFGL
jgi:hypothetical protein